MNKVRRLNLYAALAGMMLWAGCVSPQAHAPSQDGLEVADVTPASAMAAAETVLRKMHFIVEKADSDTGILRTQPLRAAQGFEFWRSDNVGAANAAEANLHSIRRSAELRFGPVDGQLRIDCTVAVQRLSLPGNDVPSTSQAYRMHSQSTSALQRFTLEPQQRRQMTWIDLGTDEELAAEILRRIKLRISRQRKEEAT